MDLKLGHYNKDGIEVVDVEGEIDVYTAPRLRELLIDLVNKNNYQLVVNMEKVEFLDSTGLGVLVGGLKWVRAHDGSLDLVCTQERILKTFSITGWRVGYAACSARWAPAIGYFHDLAYVCAPAPLQAGVAAGLLSFVGFVAHPPAPAVLASTSG